MDLLDKLSGVVEFTPSKRYNYHEIESILKGLRQAELYGFIVAWDEGSPHVRAAYRGAGKEVSSKWNVKVYKPSKNKPGAAVVCVDLQVLDEMVNKSCITLMVPPDPTKRVLSIDDAGWGFPLCGVMVGVSDGTQVWVDVVPVEFFRHDTNVGFKTKQYLNQYAFLAGSLLATFKATPQTHRIEICSGFINTRLKDNLRKEGYDVRVTEITGLLQDKLENNYRRYVRDTIGRDAYYDPKAIGQGEIVAAYKEIVDWAWKHCPQLLKTGWSSFNKE